MGLYLMLWANCLPSKIILPLKVSSISCLKGLKTRNFHLRWSCGNIAKEIFLPHSKDASLRDHGLQPLPLKINIVLLANNIPLLKSNSKLLYKFSHSVNFGVLDGTPWMGSKNCTICIPPVHITCMSMISFKQYSLFLAYKVWTHHG